MQLWLLILLAAILPLQNQLYAQSDEVPDDPTARVNAASNQQPFYLSVAKRAASESPAVVTDNDTYYDASPPSTDKSKFTPYADLFNSMLSDNSTVTMHHDDNGTTDFVSVHLNFLIYFFGHPVSYIGIAWKGYIRIEEPGHEASSPGQQFIAPFIAPTLLDSVGPAATVTYMIDSESVWVRWSRVRLPAFPQNHTGSYQCVIFKNGSMIFMYFDIPTLQNLTGLQAGLADVYNYKYRLLGNTTQEILFHKPVYISVAKIVNNSFALITAHPSCGQLISCSTCMVPVMAPTFNCSWCFERGECGSSNQAHLQSWVMYPCHYSSDASCIVGFPLFDEMDKVARAILGFFLALFLAMLLAFFVSVCVYGYRRPESKIGQCLLDTRRQVRDRLTRLPRLPNVTYRASNHETRFVEM